MKIEVIELAGRSILGEGLNWDPERQRLLLVDILDQKLFSLESESGMPRSWSVPEKIGWVLTLEDDRLLLGLAGGLAVLDTGSRGNSMDYVQRLHDPASPLRLNDAKVDPHGCLWFGSMNGQDESQAVGKLYRWHAHDEQPVVMDEGYCVTNGPTFSLDGRTLYHADSARRVVYAFDLDPAGRLSNKRVWLTLTGPIETEGYPDGMTTDAEGHVWMARWGAACVVRHHGISGEELLRIETGAPHTSNVCFGGPDLTDLYITSARVGLSEAALAQWPHSGALMRVRSAGSGVPATPWARKV